MEKIIKLKDSQIKRLDYGHWWIFSNEIEKIDTSIPPGEKCRFEYQNGKPCAVGFFNPHSLISGRILVKNSYSLETDFVKNRLEKAYEYRKTLGLEKNCRLFFGESDFIGGLIIDKYDEVFVVQLMSAGADALKEEIVKGLYDLFSPKAIVIKRDHPYRALEGLELKEDEILGKLPKKIIIEENGAKFKIDISEGQKTGWYFDQRENRKFLIPFFKGKKVLDLYCYTGAFSVIAAKNEAEIVWGIDSSQNAIDTALENAKLNNIDEKNLIFKKENAETALEALEENELPIKPDIILLDPPNLVRNKKNLEQATKLYISLLSKAFKGVEKHGYTAFSTCSQHITRDIFEDIIKRAAMLSKRKAFILELRFQSKDHPVIIGMDETKYLNFALIKIV